MSRTATRRPQPAVAGAPLLLAARRSGADGPVLLTVRGRLDATTAPRLARTVAGQLAAGRARLLVDLEGARLVDAAALRSLLAARAAAVAAGGELRVVCGDSPSAARTRRLLRVTGLAKLLGSHATTGEALAALPRP